MVPASAARAGLILLGGPRLAGSGGGGSSSPLSTVVDGLAANAWGTLTASSLTSTLMTRGLTSGIMPYSKRGHADSANGALFFYGGTHDDAMAYRNYTIEYDIATNAWTDEADAWDDGQQTHGYWHFALNRATGRQYGRAIGSSEVYSRSGPGQAWALTWDFGGMLFADWNNYNAIEWFPDANAGAGGLVFASGAEILLSNAGVTSGMDITPAGYATTMGGGSTYGNFTCYDPVSQSVYTGGSGSNLSMFKIAADGTVTAAADLQHPVNSDTTDSTSGMIYPATSGNKMFSVRESDGAIFEYTAGTNSWTATAWSVPFALNADYFGIPVPDEGCLLFVYGNDIAPNQSMQIWRH